ncbi:hypothetical protein AAF712_014327 [Marasmius tenuissimus]|uniref:Uncharacterized protein n=1 Tax=Marasmius tenuissimus TaxID=585030 RepID=A0ABR2ZC82_9AGAR
MEVSHGSSSNLWIRPRTGEICLGPAGPSLNRGIFTLRGVISQNVPHPEPSPLPLSMYSNLTFTDNMVKNTSSEFVLNALFKESLYKWISIQLYLHPNINDTQTSFDYPRRVEAQFNLNECYLFVLPPPQLPDTAPDVAAWLRASAESLYYWSLDPTGDSVMPETQRVALHLPSFYQSIHPLEPTHWTVEVYDLVRQWQEAQGFDPTTTDFARSLCYPILEILPQNGSRLEDCVEDDEDSKSEPALEGMEVDDCFEMNFSSQDASFLREPFQESSMDVDMEDCSNLMANLHVEVTPMDE